MDTSIGTVIAEKIKDFAEEGIPEVFDRDLSLGRIQPPARGNLVNVIVGVRRCGKTVSYTHLDVYKRQGGRRPAHPRARTPRTAGRRARPGARSAGRRRGERGERVRAQPPERGLAQGVAVPRLPSSPYGFFLETPASPCPRAFRPSK